MNHFPDNTKSRASYLPLLELSVKENPLDDRNMHYLGREYMYYKEYKKAISTLKKHLKLKTSTWKDERCASMRFIARCYKNLKKYDSAKKWALLAIKEAPYLRDPYLECALIDYEQNNWDDVIYNCIKALNIKKNEKTYINEIFCYDHTIYDLLSLAFYYKHEYDVSLIFVKKALKISPNNKRLKNNKKLIYNKVKEK